MTDNLSELPSLALITRYVTALRSQDPAAMQDLRAPDFTLDWVHNDAFANALTNLEGASHFWSAWFSAFPEMDYEITRTIAADDLVVTQWTFTGTQSGPLGAPIINPVVEATGKTIRLRGVSVFDIDSDLVKKETIYIDFATLWVELGVAP